MEYSLHRQLKVHYAGARGAMEVTCHGYRIDVVLNKTLIEIQHGSLAAIRRKVSALLADGHRVRIVKPVVAQKVIVKRKSPEGRVLHRRRSPKRGSLINLFDELVYFTHVFPHKRLVLEVALVEVEEWRYPGHGRRRRRRASDYTIEDQRLLRILSQDRFRAAKDLLRLLPKDLPQPFHTAELAQRMNVDRWVAQRIAYCLRETGAVPVVGKKGNAMLYALPSKSAA